ncbi:MAG: GNAT family N-acetyltransferase [Chloroflexi bacterium]|nr:GNAT family N-acetyltransferase [Chloroflexota bacterium]
MNTPTVRPLRKCELAQFGRSISRAFFTDPLMQYIEPDEEKRRKFGNWFLTRAIAYCERWGEVYTDENLAGGGAWLTPGNTTMTTMRILRIGLWQLPFRLGTGGLARLNKFDSATAKVHKRVVKGDHWYLLLLGVDPDQQSNGIGSAAIEVGAAKAQQAGLPVYLETMTQSNVDYYQKRGFEVAEEFDVDDQLHVWAMVRQPS